MSPSSTRRGSHADPYSLIASFYDRLMDHVDYPGWAALLERLCYRHGQRPPHPAREHRDVPEHEQRSRYGAFQLRRQRLPTELTIGRQRPHPTSLPFEQALLKRESLPNWT